MYRIDNTDATVVDAYANDRASELRPVILDFLNGREISLPVRNRRTVRLAIGANTLTRQFLLKLYQPNQLETLLKMNYQKQKDFIAQLKRRVYPDDLIFKPLGAGIYDKYFDGHPEPYDYFNEICNEIFVNQGYEQIDKWQFITDTNLRICPYCGKEEVVQSRRSKRQIDHYLPKRKYPFFALSYYNMIPACDLCNESPNKGQKDPLVERNKSKVIMHPYGLNNTILRFHLEVADTRIYEPENFEVILGFKDKSYLDGYDNFFDLSDRYSCCNHDASEDYIRLMNFKADNYYDEMHIDRHWLARAYQAVTGYTPTTDKPSIKRLHRMRNDIFRQLNKLRPVSSYYTKRSGAQPELLD